MKGERNARPLESATAFAPATVANVGPGFDILGFALRGVGDQVTVSRTTKHASVTIESIRGIPGAEGISLDPARNTSGAPLFRILEELRPGFGFSVRIEKGIPLGSGMGGSAASAVGAVIAANSLLDSPLPRSRLLDYALDGEAVASGSRHADNIAPCLHGGLTLCLPGNPPEVVPLPYPISLLCVLVHPEMRLDTRKARDALSSELPLKTHVQQSARLAALIAGFCQRELPLIQKGLNDLLIEPQRAHLIPGFKAVQEAALKSGALGCSISGAGPSLFAFVGDAATASRCQAAMIRAFRESGKLESRGWISPISAVGSEVK